MGVVRTMIQGVWFEIEWIERWGLDLGHWA